MDQKLHSLRVLSAPQLKPAWYSIWESRSLRDLSWPNWGGRISPQTVWIPPP